MLINFQFNEVSSRRYFLSQWTFFIFSALPVRARIIKARSASELVMELINFFFLLFEVLLLLLGALRGPNHFFFPYKIRPVVMLENKKKNLKIHERLRFVRFFTRFNARCGAIGFITIGVLLLFLFSSVSPVCCKWLFNQKSRWN